MIIYQKIYNFIGYSFTYIVFSLRSVLAPLRDGWRTEAEVSLIKVQFSQH